jgi:hypothetical protein
MGAAQARQAGTDTAGDWRQRVEYCKPLEDMGEYYGGAPHGAGWERVLRWKPYDPEKRGPPYITERYVVYEDGAGREEGYDHMAWSVGVYEQAPKGCYQDSISTFGCVLQSCRIDGVLHVRLWHRQRREVVPRVRQLA